MLHNTFNAHLSADFYSNAEAVEWANGIVWDEIEIEAEDIRHGDHIATVQGDVGVWYDYVGGYYFFTEEIPFEKIPY